MNEIAGVISAQGRAALCLRDFFYRAAPGRAQIFTFSSPAAWPSAGGSIAPASEDASVSATTAHTALGALAYCAENRCEVFISLDGDEAYAFTDRRMACGRDLIMALRSHDVAMLSPASIAIHDGDGMQMEKRPPPIGSSAASPATGAG